MARPKNQIDSVIYELIGESEVWIHFPDERIAVIDAIDLDCVSQHRWCIKRNGYIQANGCRVQGRETLTVHIGRLILGVEDPDVFVDHKDRDPTNNRRCNLREATPQQNSLNRCHPTTGQIPRVVESEDLHRLLGHRTISSEATYVTVERSTTISKESRVQVDSKR